MTAPVVPPIATLVAVTWLKTLTQLTPFVAPGDITTGIKAASTWVHDFSIVATQITPPTNPYVPVRDLVVQIDVYGRPRTGETKLPWNRTEAVALLVEKATFNPVNPGVVTIPGDYYQARIAGISLASGVRRINQENSVLARASLDIFMSYHDIS